MECSRCAPPRRGAAGAARLGLLVELAGLFDGVPERGFVEVVIALAITDKLVALELFAIVPLRLLLELLVHIASVVRGRLIAALTPRRQRRSAATTDAPSVTGSSWPGAVGATSIRAGVQPPAHRTEARGIKGAGGWRSHVGRCGVLRGIPAERVAEDRREQFRGGLKTGGVFPLRGR